MALPAPAPLADRAPALVAKRMAEQTGIEAKTIHRLLETDPKNGGFKRNAEYQLECDQGDKPLSFWRENGAKIVRLPFPPTGVSAIGTALHRAQ
jgi:hypothetical protein